MAQPRFSPAPEPRDLWPLQNVLLQHSKLEQREGPVQDHTVQNHQLWAPTLNPGSCWPDAMGRMLSY